MAQALITRRRLMGVGLAAGAVVACAGVIRLRDAAPGMRVLSPAEVEVVDLLGQALWPAGNALGVPWVGAIAVDDLLADIMPTASVIPFRYSLRGLATACLLGGTRLHVMSAEERLDLLHAWSEGALPRRLSHDGIKAILGFAYFNHPQVLEAVGFTLRCQWLPE